MADVKTGSLRVVLLGGILFAIIGLIGYGATAMAQEQQQPTEQAAEQPAEEFKEEVVVTGTLIPRPTLEAMSPVSTMEIEEIAYRGMTRLEDLLVNLPQVFVSQNSTISNGASGTATVDLRNIGSERTLVLIDGRRMSNGDAWEISPDINFIPAVLLKRVDILTGGASAVYGADAVSGVVNFVLDTDFEGVRGGIQFGGFNHYNDNAMVQSMNEAVGYAYPTGWAWDGGALEANVAFGGKFAEGRGHASVYLDYRNVAELRKDRRDYTNCSTNEGDDGPECVGSSTIPDGRFLVYDANWSRKGDYTLDRTGPGDTFRRRTGADTYNYAPRNYMQRPDQRFIAGGFLNYQWNEHFEGYADVMLMQDRSVGQIAESANFGNTTLINCDNPMLSPDQYQKICVAAGWGPHDYANLVINRRNVEGGGRTYDFRHNNFRLVGGLRGDISNAWSYDVYGLHAETSNPQVNGNQLSAVRLQDALIVDGDPNDESTWHCRSGNTGCVPWNVFRLGGVTQASLDYVSLPLLLNSGTKTQLVSAKLTSDGKEYGLAFPTAAEGFQFALGGEYRRESLYIDPDDANYQGSAAGSGGPIYPVDGLYDVKELFAEALIPILQGVPGAQDLSLELGYRWSDYSTSGSWPTYKAQASWAPGAGLKFRAGYNRATRSPNVVDLYTIQGLSLFGVADPCAGESPVYTAEQCARTGVPLDQYGQVLDNPADQYNTFTGGNPLLNPEIADTYTAGIVFAPGNFTATLDYYDITIEDAIDTLVAEDILNTCAQTGNPALCSLIHRDVAGTLWLLPDGYTITTNQNIGQYKSKGVDATLGYILPAGNSFFNFNLIGTYMMDSYTNTGIYSYDCVGYFGDQCATPIPEWRHMFRASWETGGLAITLGWRYIGSTTNDDLSDNPALASPGTEELHAINDYDEIPAFNYFDLAFSLKLMDGLQFIVGANNLLDKEPPLAPGNQYWDYGVGFYGMYDPYGRYIHGAIQFTF